MTRSTLRISALLIVRIEDHLAVILGLKDTPGELVNAVLDKMDAAVAKGRIHSGGMHAAGHSGIHLIPRCVWKTAHFLLSAKPVVPKLVAILQFVPIGLA